MNAKDNFREGHIILQRPFNFYELEHGLPKFTIVYAYIERPVFEDELNLRGKETFDELEDAGSFYAQPRHKRGVFESREKFEERIAAEYERALQDMSNYSKKHVGNMVQTQIDGVNISFFPDEYKAIEPGTLQELLFDDSYALATNNENIFDLPEMEAKIFYLRSRGIDKDKAKRLSSFGLKDLVVYIPHPEVQKMFCRENEVIYTPEFDGYYKEVYGSFEDYRKTC